jgi:DinB superfamily
MAARPKCTRGKVGQVKQLDRIVQKLAEAQSAFFRAADAVPSDQWTIKPSTGAWSAAELVAHLVILERAVLGGADRISQKKPKPVPFLKRRHLPLWLVEARIIRRKSPIPLDPNLIGDKEEMLGELRAARERTLAFLDETKSRDLSAYCWHHAFLGMLDVYEWFEMIAAHQVRHTKQIREIAARLPKVVGISQN